MTGGPSCSNIESMTRRTSDLVLAVVSTAALARSAAADVRASARRAVTLALSGRPYHDNEEA
jgi:hypothetical protein